LVLDKQYSGLVFGLDARIHVRVKPLLTATDDLPNEIVVRSPQFKEAIWEYGYRNENGGVEVSQLQR
jgi:phosphomevalonate kinase